MKFTCYGHFCFLVETEVKKILFDPFVSNSELATHISITELEADFMMVSHGLEDHISVYVSLAQFTHAPVVSHLEIFCFYDSALTLGLQIDHQWAKLNFAILPIGDNFTMG